MNGPASSAGNASGIAARVSARASMYSAYPPSKSTPVTLRCTHMAKSPRRHWAQTKQCPPCQPTPTRCPGLQGLTLSPTASMWPAISCPGTRGYSSPGQRPSLTNTSLWQMPHASTFTRTCPARGSGITRSTTSHSLRGLLICVACICVVIHAPMRDACRRGTAGVGIVRTRRSITVNLEDRFGTGLRSCLRQMVPDAARVLLGVHPRVRPDQLDRHMREEDAHRLAVRRPAVVRCDQDPGPFLVARPRCDQDPGPFLYA